jgi:hypothetical protein
MDINYTTPKKRNTQNLRLKVVALPPVLEKTIQNMIKGKKNNII